MARRREQDRISRRRAEFRAAQRRLARAERAVSKISKTVPDPDEFLNFRERQAALIRRQQVALEATEIARGKVRQAILAPARAKLRDIDRRPERYKNAAKSRREATRQLEIAERKANKVRISHVDRQKTARDKIAEALQQGRDIDDVYKDIAKAAGVPAHVAYTMFLYADNPTAKAA